MVLPLNPPPGPAEFRPLNPDLVAQQMQRAATTLSPLLAGYLISGSDDAWTPVDRWLVQQSAGDEETRWGTLEMIATLTKSVIRASGGVDARYLPPEADLLDAGISPADAAGITDAIRLITANDDPAAELNDSWLVYATPACPARRFTTAAAVLLNAMSTLIAGAARRANVSPVEVWQRILPPPVGPQGPMSGLWGRD